LLAEVAEGLAAVDQPAAALDAARQAQLIAARTPDLLPAQRSQVFSALRTLSPQLGDPTFSREIEDLARNPFLTPAGTLVTATVPVWPTTEQRVPYDPPTQAAIQARSQAAALLATRLGEDGNADTRAERAGLAQALAAEEQARAQFYQAALAGAPAPQDQIWLLEDRLHWLATRLRVARQGYGLSLVPDWEQAESEIAAQLGEAYNNLGTALDSYAAALPTPVDQARQRVANHYFLAAELERGLYPATPEDLGERIRRVEADLAAQTGPLALPVLYDPAAPIPGFRIRSD
jgi:hypothetical protein